MSDDHRELIAKDIVDQLRLHKPQFTAGVCSRAIQEITRLRAELAELRAKYADTPTYTQTTDMTGPNPDPAAYPL